MSRITYTTGKPEQWDDIIDFANYVFSQAHRPHDFRKLLPCVYGRTDGEPAGWHFIALRDDGHIRGLVADRPQILTCPGGTLRAGFVGTVSVHPYSRGEGHMKHLMADMIADAEARGYDLLVLGGQRQRYNYFGFEQTGWGIHYQINPTNVRHCLGKVAAEGVTFTDVTDNESDDAEYAFGLAGRLPVHGDRPRDRFLSVMQNWSSPFRLILIDGIRKGYIAGDGAEIVLEDENDLTRVIKAYFETYAPQRMTVICGPHEKKRIGILTLICGSRSIEYAEMVRVINWRRVIETLMRYKASFSALDDGCFTLAADDCASLTIRVENSQISVTEEGREPDLRCDRLTAERTLFGLEGLTLPGAYRNWFPLPFYMTSVDTF